MVQLLSTLTSRKMIVKTITVNALLLSVVTAAPFPGILIERESQLLAQYDYVIVGGGTSGMVVANRLTENPTTTVLVIEAGEIDQLTPQMLYPKFYDQAQINHTWPITGAPMSELNNRTHQVYVAKVLGGGTAINGMTFDRGARGDYDLWGELIGDQNAWCFDKLLPYFKKSETFNPPSQELINRFNITWDISARGTKGPIHGSFPPFIQSTSSNFIAAARQLNIDTPREGGDGNALGVFWTPNTIDPVRYERSYPRNTYHITSSLRANYHLLHHTQVTKLTFNGSPQLGKISGVEYVSANATSYASAVKTLVKAKKEVIMAAGAIQTPRLLQISGIGPKALLQSLGIPLAVDLPGVGENLQDHPVAFLGWTSTVPPPPEEDPAIIYDPAYDALMGELYVNNRTGPWTVSTGNILGFFSPKHISFPTTFLNKLSLQSRGQYLRPGTPSAVISGYEKVKSATLRLFRQNKLAMIEATFSRFGTLDGLMHPLSRGFVQTPTSDPLSTPFVDWRALTNPFDWDVMISSIRWQQTTMSQAPAIKIDVGATPTTPDPNLTDEELKTSLRQSMWPSFAHLSSTCSMLKREDGGVVDKNLKVYGISGLRIVDASVFPIVPGAHLQATVYAVAERAADIIKYGL